MFLINAGVASVAQAPETVTGAKASTAAKEIAIDLRALLDLLASIDLEVPGLENLTGLFGSIKNCLFLKVFLRLKKPNCPQPLLAKSWP